MGGGRVFFFRDAFFLEEGDEEVDGFESDEGDTDGVEEAAERWFPGILDCLDSILGSFFRK